MPQFSSQSQIYVEWEIDVSSAWKDMPSHITEHADTGEGKYSDSVHINLHAYLLYRI